MAIHEANVNSKIPDARNDEEQQAITPPSKLFVQYSKAESDDTDREDLLLNILSALATQGDLVKVWGFEMGAGSLPDWIWNTMALSATVGEDGLPIGGGYESGTTINEWWVGLKLIASILPNLSPFDIHQVATQSSTFTEASQAHLTLWLLLCTYSLQQCPAPLENRWRRWQSLTCETIRLFQNFGMDMDTEAVPIWTRRIVPACRHVMQQLPNEALHTALISGLVGTTTQLAARECSCEEELRQSQLQQSLFLSHGQDLIHSLREIAEHGGNSEIWVWSDPWRSADGVSLPDNDDDETFEKHKTDSSWWSKYAHRHEKVAGMDTAWNEAGTSILAVLAFDDRPQTLQPSFIWKTWFPHVAILFKASAQCPILESLAFLLLEKLVETVPEMSLDAVRSGSKHVDAPYETFELLSNRLMVKPPKKSIKHVKKNAPLEESKIRSEMIVSHMKSLLACYPPVNQVKIVRKLVHDCPHPALKAKFLDLLRPTVFEEESTDALWSLIGSYVKDMLVHVNEEKKELVNTVDLIEKVELYVAAITMLQLWCMSKNRLPKKVKGSALGKFFKLLKGSIATWMGDSSSMPPDDYYRLYLLEGSLQQLMQSLDAARQKRSSDSQDDEDVSSFSTEQPQSTSTLENSWHSKTFEDVVVGDADIFT